MKNIILSVLLLTAICARAAAAWDGNVLLIGWDGTQRAQLQERLAAGELPNLQQLAGEGSLVFTDITTGATETKPGWAEMLTGYSAPALRIRDNRDYRPVPAGQTVFERLEQHFGPGRIATVFLSGKINNLGARGPHEICLNCIARDPATRRKTLWWDRKGLTSTATRDGKPPNWVRRDGEPYFNALGALDLYAAGLGEADAVGAKALAALKKYRKQKFFALFHFEEPDEDAHLHGENSKEYGDAMKTADRWLGELVRRLKKLGLYEKTVIFVATDHGMDEDGFNHLKAPETFVAVNGGIKLRRGDRKDITPTLLDLYGIDPAGVSPALEGVSLLVKP